MRRRRCVIRARRLLRVLRRMQSKVGAISTRIRTDVGSVTKRAKPADELPKRDRFHPARYVRSVSGSPFFFFLNGAPGIKKYRGAK